MKSWQFNVLFFVSVGGVVLLLIGPEIGIDVGDNPTAVSGLGLILTYVLTQKVAWTKKNDDKKDDTNKPDDKEGG